MESLGLNGHAEKAIRKRRIDKLISDDERERRQTSRTSKKPGDALETFGDTDMANSLRLARRHGHNFRFTSAAGWLVWDGRRWAEDEKDVRIQELGKDVALSIFDEIKHASDRDALMRHAKHSQSRRAIENMISLSRSEAGILAQLTDFDRNAMLLNVENGTVELRTGMLREHRREDLLTKIVPITFDPKAECPRWIAFIERVCGGLDDLCGYLRRLVGYVLTGDTTEQVLHFLYGLGANGKSIFSELLAELLGDYAVTCSPDLIMRKKHAGIPNDVARLRGARVALMNETSQGAEFDESKLKDLTGGDSLSARFLHREFFDFKPTHKLVIRGNFKPSISGTDEGIWRRLRLVPFTVGIPADQQDRQLLSKLRAELPGILRWAVEGCLEWQRHGLNPPAVISDAVAEYRAESDVLGRFIGECCEVRPVAQVRAGVLFQRLQQFAEQLGERCLPSKELPSEMRRRGFVWQRTKLGGVYYGIGLIATEGQPWTR